MFKIACIFFLMVWLKGLSQQADRILTLPAAVRLSQSHYPSLQSRQALVNAAQAHVAENRALRLPLVILNEEVNAGTDNSLVGAYFPMGVIPSASGGTRSFNNTKIATGNIATLAAQWEMCNFGKYRAQINEAGEALQLSEYDLLKENYSIELTTALTYLQLVKYRLLLNIQQRNINRTQIIKRSIGAYVQGGLKAGVDTSIAASELSKDRLTYIDLLNTYHSLRTQLATLTGTDTASIQPDTTLSSQLNVLLTTEPTTDTGYMKHPQLLFYNALYKDQLGQLKVIQKSFLPKIYLMGAGWMRGSSIKPNDYYDQTLSNGLLFSRYNYLLGAALTYNITDSRSAALKANVQRFKASAALQNYNEQKLIIAQDYSIADAGLKSYVQMLAEIPIQLKAAREGYIQKLSLYNNGLTNIVDLTNALYLLNRAETDAVVTNAGALKSVMLRAYAGNFLSQVLNAVK